MNSTTFETSPRPSIAVAYRDIVATEKQWVHVANKAKVERMLGTTLLSNIADLAAVP
jgi:hypothetical protein